MILSMCSPLTRSLCRNLIYAILLTIPCGTLGAAANVEQYFPELTGYSFEAIAEIADPQKQDRIGPFSRSVLNEYILLSYSRWRIRSENSLPHPPLELEVYEMQDAAGTFGIFSTWDTYSENHSKNRLKLSVDNHKHADSLCFWRGVYFFRLIHSSTTEANWREAQELAAALVEAIPLINLHPVTVVHLPQDGLIRESVRFYLGKSSFASNNHFPKELQTKIGFEKDVEIAFARYLPGNYSLFLLEYPTVALAADRSVQLQDAMESYFSPQGVYMKRVGVLIALFFGPEPEAQRVLEKVHYTPTIKWIYEKDIDPIPRHSRDEILTLLGVFERSMLMTVFLLSMTIGGGAGLGLIRYRIRQLYPPGSPKDGAIYLNLKSKIRN